MSDRVKVASAKKKEKAKSELRTKKVDPEMELEGNQKLNQIRKKQFKREKKQRNRREKVAQQLAAGLENFSLDTGKDMSVENYEFDRDFVMK